MPRFLLASIAVVIVIAVAPYAGEAQKPTQKTGALPKFNQVYVKIILPIEPAKREKDGLIVESWIAKELKKRGQTKFTAATAWVPLTNKGKEMEWEKKGKVWEGESTDVWDGRVNGEQWCPVDGRIAERANGRIKVLLSGSFIVTVSLTDEPGTREIVAGEKATTEEGLPYVAILIGPPPEKLAAPKK
jgi:hypothetical protein